VNQGAGMKCCVGRALIFLRIRKFLDFKPHFPNDRIGSPLEDRHRHPESPHLRVEPTKSRQKQKSPLECRLSGVHRTYLGWAGNSLISQIRTFKHPATNV
jgi:hypothetical protein